MLQSGLGAVARHSLSLTLGRTKPNSCALSQVASALPSSSFLSSPSIPAFYISSSSVSASSFASSSVSASSFASLSSSSFSSSSSVSPSSRLSSCTELQSSSLPGTPYLQHHCHSLLSFPLRRPRSSSSSSLPVCFLPHHHLRAFSSSAFLQLAAEDGEDQPTRARRGRPAKDRSGDRSDLLGLGSEQPGTKPSSVPSFLFDPSFDRKQAVPSAASEKQSGAVGAEEDGEEAEEAEKPNAFDDFDDLDDETVNFRTGAVISEDSEVLTSALETKMNKQELRAAGVNDDDEEEEAGLHDLMQSLLEPDEGVPEWFRRMTPAMQARTDLSSPESVDRAKALYDLRQASRQGDVATIRRIRQGSKSVKLTRLTYDYEIYAAALARQPLEAYNVFKRMMELGLQVTEVTSANLLLAYFRSGLYEDCFAMFEYLQSLSAESQPDELVYNLMIMTCAKVQKPERAMLFFEAMQQTGRKPLPRTFTALIHASSRCVGWYEETFRLVRQMKDEYGYNINDVRVWTSLMYACAYAGDIQGSKQVLLAMSQYGHPITDRYLALMLRCLAISSKNASPNAIKQNIETADRVWKQVEELTNSRPHTFALNAYMEVFAKTGRVQRAELIFRSYEKYQAAHDAKSHTILILMYLKMKKFTEAEALHRRLMASGLQHNNKIYGCMVRGFARANYFRSSLRYLHEMIKAGVKPHPSETKLLAMKTYDYPHIRTMIGLLLKEAGITGLDLQPYFRTNKTPTRLFSKQKGGESGAFKHALLTTGTKLGMGPEFTQEPVQTIFRFNRPRSMKPVAKRHGKTKSFRKGL